MCHSKIEYLIKEGLPPFPVLYEAWSNIYAEYIDISGNEETKYLLLLQRDIALDTYTCSVQSDIAVYLLPECSEIQKIKLTEIISSKGFDIKPSYEDTEALEIALNRIESKLAPIKLRLVSKTNEYQKYIENKKNDTIPEAFFDSMLTRLWKYYRQPLRAKEITVTEFVHLVKNYLEEIKIKNEQIEEYGTKGRIPKFE